VYVCMCVCVWRHLYVSMCVCVCVCACVCAIYQRGRLTGKRRRLCCGGGIASCLCTTVMR